MIDRIVVWALRLKSERGQDIMEYAILTGTIAVVLFATLALFVGTDAEGPLFDFFTRLGAFVDDLAP